MTPHDTQLCIVPGPEKKVAGEQLILPFDGDRTLSIILSKMFLLADDSKIKNPTIRSQLERA